VTRKAPSTLVERLRFARELRGLSASETSKRAGLSRPHVTILESRDADPDRIWDSTVQELARVLQVDFRWLRYGDGELPVALPPVAEVRRKKAPKIETPVRARMAASGKTTKTARKTAAKGKVRRAHG
jgi:transcriptional regulator with XRE-family HTH domain